jgi:hypothetical protein
LYLAEIPVFGLIKGGIGLKLFLAKVIEANCDQLSPRQHEYRKKNSGPTLITFQSNWIDPSCFYSFIFFFEFSLLSHYFIRDLIQKKKKKVNAFLLRLKKKKYTRGHCFFEEREFSRI